MYCSQFHVDCWSHLRCRRALHQDKPRDVDIDHRQRHRCDCASRGRGERDKMEAERECREIVQGTQFQNWILSNGFNENNESSWKDSTWYWILPRGFVRNLKSSQLCLCFQVEVLPAIKAYEPRTTDLVKAPMNRFHAEWEVWLAKLQGCLFPREKKSGYYRNLEFDNTCIGAIAVCLANVRIVCFRKYFAIILTGWQDPTLWIYLWGLPAEKAAEPGQWLLLVQGYSARGFPSFSIPAQRSWSGGLRWQLRFVSVREVRRGAQYEENVCTKQFSADKWSHDSGGRCATGTSLGSWGRSRWGRRRRRKSRQWWTWMRLRTINWIWKHSNNIWIK